MCTGSDNFNGRPFSKKKIDRCILYNTMGGHMNPEQQSAYLALGAPDVSYRYLLLLRAPTVNGQPQVEPLCPSNRQTCGSRYLRGS